MLFDQGTREPEQALEQQRRAGSPACFRWDMEEEWPKARRPGWACPQSSSRRTERAVRGRANVSIPEAEEDAAECAQLQLLAAPGSGLQAPC